MATHYETLSVSASASTDEIRKAYHKLARTHHPDRFSDPVEKAKAEQQFTAMTEAFNVLTSIERRRSYDAGLRQQATGESHGQREAKSYHRAAMAKISEGQPDEAIRLLRSALHLDATQGGYHALLAQALQSKGQLGEAGRAWDEALKLEPFNAKYYRLAGECLEKAGMLTRARRMYENALKWDKNDAASAEALARLSTSHKDDGGKGGFLGGLFKKA